MSIGDLVVLRNPPVDIRDNVWTSDTELRGWPEQQLTLNANLPLDHAGPGLVDQFSDLLPVTLTAGTKVQTWMVRLDPVTAPQITLSGSITYDTPILGVIVIKNRLDATDVLLGHPGIMYNNNVNRGMELADGTNLDTFEISADGLRITYLMNVTNGPTDDIRIITASPPTSCPGDADDNYAINFADITEVLENWGMLCP